MAYQILVSEDCLSSIRKLSKKNRELGNALKDKMCEILENPYRYKPLKNDLAGQRRVHVMKSFVLRFEVDEKSNSVKFTFFGHHDEAYKR